jgi:hypothetical protein
LIRAAGLPWVSPDIMVDTNNDNLDDTSVLFGENNKLKVRLRNRGNVPGTVERRKLHHLYLGPLQGERSDQGRRKSIL